jgi:hypothetical protein
METCMYQMAVGSCNAPIERDENSYSGYRHVHGADWCHWATTVSYGPQSESMGAVFVKCSVCGKTGPDNEAHIRFDGHRFVAEEILCFK